MLEKPKPETLTEKVARLEEENRRLRECLSAQQEREEKDLFLTENAIDVILIQDMDLRVTYASPSIESMFGYSPEEALEMDMEKAMTADSYQRAVDSFKRAVPLADKSKNPDIPLMEYEYVRKDGSTFWGELKVVFLYDDQGRPVGCQGILRNIDARKKAEQAMRDSEFKLRTLFDLSPQAISLTEVETGILIDVNDKYCELTGFSKDEIIGRTVVALGFYSAEKRKKILEELEDSGEVRGEEIEVTFKDGAKAAVLAFARIIHLASQSVVLTVYYDTTEERRLEAQFLRAQKMEAIGNLAGGMAHDFNNLLMAVQGNVSIMLLNINPDHPHFPMLKNIEKQVQSGVGLTRQLLGYARKGKYEVLSIDLNTVLKETMESFSRARKEIRIHEDLSSDLYAVEADQGQLEQIFLNLFVNAADAMPGGGELFIETENATHLDMKREPYEPRPGNYIQIRVRDTGMGMGKMTMDRIFDPFFTTKEMGRGTGLGLASVYGIVKGHGGYIDVDSEEGKGSVFSLFFPASGNAVQRATPAQRPPAEGSGTILLVDDEERVLNITAKLLEHMGYRVIKAASGEEAFECYKNDPEGIDIVILDMVMPDLSGSQTLEILKCFDPKVKVLLCSGYSLDSQATEILALGCEGFIQKPYNTNDLSRKLQDILVKSELNN